MNCTENLLPPFEEMELNEKKVFYIQILNIYSFYVLLKCSFAPLISKDTLYADYLHVNEVVLLKVNVPQK